MQTIAQQCSAEYKESKSLNYLIGYARTLVLVATILKMFHAKLRDHLLLKGETSPVQ